MNATEVETRKHVNSQHLQYRCERKTSGQQASLLLTGMTHDTRHDTVQRCTRALFLSGSIALMITHPLFNRVLRILSIPCRKYSICDNKAIVLFGFCKEKKRYFLPVKILLFLSDITILNLSVMSGLYVLLPFPTWLGTSMLQIPEWELCFNTFLTIAQ